MNRKEYLKVYREIYTKSVKGVIIYIWHHQIRNCKQRNHPLPTYSFQELYDWCLQVSDFMYIYMNWVNSNYDPELKPSINRLDNNKTYSLDNIEVITWKSNKEKAYKDIRNNLLHNPTLLNNGHRPVSQYDFNGNKVNSFISVSDAARSNNIGHQAISECCKEIRKSYKGFLWCYSDNEHKFTQKLTSEFLADIKTSRKSKIPLVFVLTHKDGQEKEVSTSQAATILGVSRFLVKKYAAGNTPLTSDLVSSIRKKR